MTKTEQFISKAQLVHGTKYNYEKTIYLKSKTKVVINCPEHGCFEQTPNSHLNGQGCPSCGELKKEASKKLKIDDVINRCVKTHGDRYDYSRVKYKKVTDKVDIICEKHGLFSQALINHYRGQGCPSCGKVSMGENQRLNGFEFVKRSRAIHGDKYEYDLSTYDNYRSKLKIICKKHGPFLQSAENHYSSGAGCPSCAVRLSKGENEIFDLITSLGFECVKTDRSIIKPLELDIVIPELKIAIEYNGLIWHSEKYGKDKWYHHNKTKACNDVGYRLIHIWEDDWNNNKDLQIGFLKHQMGVSNSKPIYARKCDFSSPEKKVIESFLDKHHVQGSTVFSKAVCLSFQGELVSVTCFTRRVDKYEIVRHCNSKTVIGSLGKTVRNFSRYNKGEIYTFLDKSRFSGVSYEKAGFKLESEIPPDYSYLLNGRRYHKFNFRRKQIARKHPEVYSDELTEKEMMEKAGYHRLWDCGKKRYVFNH